MRSESAATLASAIERCNIPDRAGVDRVLNPRGARMSLSFILVTFVLPGAIIAAAVALARITRERVG